jgi:hypothetical protein
MAKVTKERVASICKRVNQGVRPSYAVREEGLGGSYLTMLKESGIIFKDPITGKWQAMLRIHDERFEKFSALRTSYHLKANSRSRAVTKREPVRVTPKVGMFRRIWNSIFG